MYSAVGLLNFSFRRNHVSGTLTGIILLVRIIRYDKIWLSKG